MSLTFLTHLAATRPTEITVIDQAAPTLPPRNELIFDKKEAWDHYQKFIKAEKNLRRRRVQYDAQEFFGDAGVLWFNCSHLYCTNSVRHPLDINIVVTCTIKHAI